jgi:hypothetical protein
VPAPPPVEDGAEGAGDLICGGRYGPFLRSNIMSSPITFSLICLNSGAIGPRWFNQLWPWCSVVDSDERASRWSISLLEMLYEVGMLLVDRESGK